MKVTWKPHTKNAALSRRKPRECIALRRSCESGVFSSVTPTARFWSLALPRNSGVATSMTASNTPRNTAAVRHPCSSINHCVTGIITTWPAVVNAVVTPSAHDRRSSGTSRLTDANTTEKDAAAIPTPTMKPVEAWIVHELVDAPITNRPAEYITAPNASTRAAPKRSATAPAIG